MKLAEALLLRSDMQKKLASLRERVGQNVKVQDGDAPAEDPAALMAAADGLLDDLERLVVRINVTNLSYKLPDGRTITEAIARRDKLAARHALVSAAIVATRAEETRYSVREIKWVVVVNVAGLQARLDDLARQLRELNGQLQQANWAAEVDGQDLG